MNNYSNYIDPGTKQAEEVQEGAIAPAGQPSEAATESAEEGTTEG